MRLTSNQWGKRCLSYVYFAPGYSNAGIGPYQRPVRELKEKRKNEARAVMKLYDGLENLGTLSGNSYELICEVESAQKAGLKLRVGEEEETLLYLDKIAQK